MIASQADLEQASLAARRTPEACAHCGEPADSRGAALRDGAGRCFCCAGCRAVRVMLEECGLTDYYRLRDAEGAGPPPAAAEAPRPRGELDAPEFLARHAVALGDDRRRIELRVDGLRCGACMWLLEALPRLEPGVLELRVDAGRSIVAIDWAPSRTTLSSIASRVERLGYRLLPLRERRHRDEERRDDRAWIVRLGIAGVLSANAMGIAFALYGGVFHGMDPSMRLFLQWVSMGLAAVSVVGPGRLFLSNAWLAIRAQAPHMDLPISLALVAAVIGGAWSTWHGGHGVYAESITMLVLLLLAGRFVQFRAQARARHQVDLLATLMPGVAKRRRSAGGSADDAMEFEEVPVEALEPGDVILVPAGETAGADGRLLDSRRWIDAQALTGECRPVRCEQGEMLHAGCRVLDAPALMQVVVAGSQTRAGRLMAMVDEAASRRAPVVQFADRIAGWFLAAVLGLAAITLALWWSAGAPVAIEHMVALLVVTCPCALGLATPLTMVASIAKAARAGILVKGGDVIERLAARGTIVLDKTGTVTEGRMRVLETHGDAAALRVAARLEAHSAHPAAKAIVEAGGSGGGADQVQECAGHGITGRVDGHRVAVGRLDFVRTGDARRSSAAPVGAIRGADSWAAVAGEIASRGRTPVAISIDGEIQAIVGVGDPIRAEARETVRMLRQRGWRVVMASGDDSRVAAFVGREIGLRPDEIHGECTPERKHALVSSAALVRPVVMVGDGVNDVVAMAAADVGVSLGGGTRASLEVGDACLTRDGIGALPPLLDGCARTLRVIHANFAVGLAYNMAGASLAITGMMNPLIAAILMPMSGLMVTTMALRATRFDAPRFASPAPPVATSAASSVAAPMAMRTTPCASGAPSRP